MFALLTYADVVALFAIAGTGNRFDPFPAVGSDGFSGLDGNIHRDDSLVSAAFISTESGSQHHRRDASDRYQWFFYIRAASARVGQATCFTRVPVSQPSKRSA